MAEERLDSVVRQALSLPPEQRPAFLAEHLGDDLEARALALVCLRELEEVTLPSDPEDMSGFDEPALPSAAVPETLAIDANTTQPSDADWPDTQGESAALSPSDFARLQSLYGLVCELPEARRSEFVERECADNSRLHDELMALLESDISLRNRTLRNAPPSQAAVQSEISFHAAAGTQVGRYSLVRQLGRGGMGTVWLAQRADGQFQRTVALKLINGGQESEAIQSRFLRERQILASLSHPNIAKLLDGGVAPDGRPYFVMEYVDGEPITSYCDERKLSVVARLRLFLQVCRAVQHAHQRLVVHRDLKPSNILVTQERMVQLLDFGIAKLLHSDLMGLSELTRAEDQAMTPRYAAPEQIRAETITTATDTYAMGVLLYELLTGRLPYAVRSAGGHALEQAILESEPRRPSLSLTDPADADCAALAALRGADISELRHAIAGDLETVLLKALKKQPAERYPSVEAFAKDLEHCLDGRPISARPDTVSYRVGKFVARHRAGVALVSMSFIGLLTALVISLIQTQRAEQAAQRSAAVDAFLVGLFESIDPELGHAGALRARDLLDAGAARVDSELATDPALQSTLNALLGRLLLATGDPQRALSRLQKARDSEHLGESQTERLQLDFARALITMQRFEEAEILLAEAQRQSVNDRAAQAKVLTLRADLDAEAGRYDLAEERGLQALELWQQLPAGFEPERAETLGTLAKIADLSDQIDIATERAGQALRLLEARFGERHLSVARMLERIANLQRRRGNGERAMQTLARAQALATELVGSDHLITLSMRRSYADLLEESGLQSEAADALNAVIADTEKRYGRFHLMRATALNSLVAIAFRQRDLDQAQANMEEVVEVYRGVYGDRHNEVATVLNNLANIVRERGQLERAETLMDEVLAIREETVGTEHMDYAYSLLGVARIAQLKGDPTAAAESFARAATLFALGQGPQSALARRSRLRQIHALIDAGQIDGAQSALASLSPHAGDDKQAQLTQDWAEARIDTANQALESAIARYAGLVPVAQDQWAARDSRRIGIALDAAHAYLQAGNAEQARILFNNTQIPDGVVLDPRMRALANGPLAALNTQ